MELSLWWALPDSCQFGVPWSGFLPLLGSSTPAGAASWKEKNPLLQMAWSCPKSQEPMLWYPTVGLAVNSTLTAAEPTAVPGGAQNWQPSLSPSTWARAVFLGVEFVLPEHKDTHQTRDFIRVGDTRHRNLSFILEGMSPHATDYWTSKNFTEMANPWIFLDLYPTLWINASYQGL